MDGSTPYGIQPELLVELCGVHIDTALRWKRQGRIPRHFRELIDLKLYGNLGVLADRWRGFRLIDGKLWSPENDCVTPGDIRAIKYRRDQLRELEKQLKSPEQWRLL